MFPSIIILGRQPALGLAELESLYGPTALQPLDHAVLLNIPVQDVPFLRLGGSIKLAKVLTVLETTRWDDLVQYITTSIPPHLNYLPEGKLKFGLSAYGLPVSTQKVSAGALTIKKAIKAADRSVRVVPNKEPALNSAQVLNNKLTGELGMELLLIRDGSRTMLAQTAQEQNIDAYAKRDHGRPARDSKVGMLPPKLAQIIINLAHPGEGEIVLDPFCGTGVILQEALLMGRYAYGTDIEKRMIDYTRQNLEHLLGPAEKKLSVGDATTFTWEDFDAIATETYLGRPFSALPKPEVLQAVRQDVDTIHKKFFKNVAMQTKSGFRMCVAVPAWKTSNGFLHLKTLDSLEELGYNRLKFVHAAEEELIYHRPGQVVARELVVLQRK